jgi:hypothetical protein
MKLLLDHDDDTNYIYIVDMNYDEGRTRDLLAFEFTQGSRKDIRGEYFLSKMIRPMRDGRLDIIGVDII